MWTRKKIKTEAKILIKYHYWWMVLVSLIILFAAGSSSGSLGGGYSAGSNSGNSYGSTDYSSTDIVLFITVICIILMVALLISAIAFAFRAFLLNPLYVGCLRYILNTRQGNRNFADIIFAFSNCYMNVVKIMFLRDVKLFLWTLLFIIPGIVKHYEYQMIPYILSENPAIDSTRAFDLTKTMTYGDKWNIFVLALSFLPWEILSACTCLIVGVFWVNPYVNVTMAELYIELREKAFRCNGVLPGELCGYTYNGIYKY